MGKSDSLFQVFEGHKMRLLPFAVSLSIYALFHVPMEQQDLYGMVLKCLPIFSLWYFVYSLGLGLSKEKMLNTQVFVGLVFALLGDAFLDFPNYFLHGTISFTIAQIINIWCFGFSPLKLPLGIKIFAIMSLPLYLTLPGIMKEETPLFLAISIYSPHLIIMIWRATARVGFGEGPLDWRKVIPCLGAISFGISDSTLGINKFFAPVPYAQPIIMSTYYFAQFALTMMVLEGVTTKAAANKKSKKYKK